MATLSKLRESKSFKHLSLLAYQVSVYIYTSISFHSVEHILYNNKIGKVSRGGAVVRAWIEFCCWFSPLLRGFFSGFSGFPPSSKTNISKFQFDWELEGHGFISWRLLCVTLIKKKKKIN